MLLFFLVCVLFIILVMFFGRRLTIVLFNVFPSSVVCRESMTKPNSTHPVNAPEHTYWCRLTFVIIRLNGLKRRFMCTTVDCFPIRRYAGVWRTLLLNLYRCFHIIIIFSFAQDARRLAVECFTRSIELLYRRLWLACAFATTIWLVRPLDFYSHVSTCRFCPFE